MSNHFRLFLLLTALVIFQLWLNFPVLGFDWVYFDDDINIVLNPHLTGGSTKTLVWAWGDLDYTRRYMPVGWMLFDGIFAVGGLNPAVYHGISWLLSALNAVLLFFAVRRFSVPDESSRTFLQRNGPAALAVAFVCTHPLRAETIGWISALLYLFASLFAWGAALLVPVGDGRLGARPRWRSAGAIACFAGSLLTYPVFLALPLLLALAEWSGAFSVRFATLVKRYGPWLVVSGAMGAVNVYATLRGQSAGSPWAVPEVDFPLARAAQVATAFGHFVTKLLCPTSRGAVELFFQLAAVIGISAGLAMERMRRATLLLAMAVVLSLAPFLNTVSHLFATNDRYTILLLAVVAVALAREGSKEKRPVIIAIAVGVLTLACAGPYRAALAVWQNSVTIQTHLDDVNALRPDPNLNYWRPAILNFLGGDYEASRKLLAAGRDRFGETPGYRSAMNFIRNVRERMPLDPALNPARPPYVFMHFEMARALAADGYFEAAEMHKTYAYRLMTGPSLSPNASRRRTPDESPPQ